MENATYFVYNNSEGEVIGVFSEIRSAITWAKENVSQDEEMTIYKGEPVCDVYLPYPEPCVDYRN